MKLGVKQELFSLLLAKLILFAYERGYQIRMGAVYETTGHMPGSLHGLKLAADLNLFRDGKYLNQTEDHRELGEWWERQHPLCCWGGRFNDGNHYSLTHGGKK